MSVSPEEHASARRLLVLAVVVAAAVAVFFVLYTGLVWEDFLITYRFSENFARGKGLIYQSGERIQGFTSPLNTLLPAVFAWITRASDFKIPLFLYRIVSLAGLLGGGWMLASALLRFQGASKAAQYICLSLPVALALEIKCVGFAMSGQESGLMIVFLAPCVVLLWTGWAERPALGGILWAGLMYTRPDSCIYVACIALTALVFETGSRRVLLRSLVMSAAVCGALYLPWFLFTWIYYGSPVPHTIIAKFGTVNWNQDGFVLFGPIVAGIRLLPIVLFYVFSSIYDFPTSGPGSFPGWLHDAAFLLAAIAVVYWLVPSKDRPGRIASFLAFLMTVYLVYADMKAPLAPWYCPPLTLVCLVVLVSAAASVAQAAPSMGRRVVAIAGAGFVLATVATTFAMALPSLRFAQETLGDLQNEQIGRWFGQHAGSSESIYLEPLGYVGYYSQGKMMDWPGLVSDQVVQARRRLGAQATWVTVAEDIRPDWILARASDFDSVSRSPVLSTQYQLVKIFDVTPRFVGKESMPGIRNYYNGAYYGVLRKKHGQEK